MFWRVDFFFLSFTLLRGQRSSADMTAKLINHLAKVSCNEARELDVSCVMLSRLQRLKIIFQESRSILNCSVSRNGKPQNVSLNN